MAVTEGGKASAAWIPKQQPFCSLLCKQVRPTESVEHPPCKRGRWPWPQGNPVTVSAEVKGGQQQAGPEERDAPAICNLHCKPVACLILRPRQMSGHRPCSASCHPKFSSRCSGSVHCVVHLRCEICRTEPSPEAIPPDLQESTAVC